MPSKKILEQKKEIVKEMTETFKAAKTMVLMDYRGLTVEEDTEMRVAVRKAGVDYKVMKNTLVKFAMKECGIEGIDSYLEGPTAIAISNNDLIAPAKVLVEYAKKYDVLKIKAGVVDGEVVDVLQINRLASLPSKEVLISKMLGSMNAPITGFVNVLNGNLRGLVVALNAVREQKESA